MEFLFELLFELIGEFLLSLVFEALAEAGFHSFAKKARKPRSPILSGFGYLLWGAIAGGLSLLIFPTSFVHSQSMKIANLIITPIILGAAMMLIGKIRKKRGQQNVALDKFTYGFLFALGMSLVRFIWAQ
jgi:hypothetical protein